MTHEEHCVLAALVSRRFGDGESAIAAWTRMFQNVGWDDDALSRLVFHQFVETGERFLRDAGLRREEDK